MKVTSRMIDFIAYYSNCMNRILNVKILLGLLDCRVSQWGEWSPCRNDGNCVGSALRTRRIIRRQRPGGSPCPPTAQSRWCATNCTTPPPIEDWRNNLT